MKKKKLSNLSLNKKVISSLNGYAVSGGGLDVTITCTGYEDCNGSPTGGGTNPPPRTVGPGCTRQTRELSYCQGVPGVPDDCLSVDPCA